MGAFKNPLCLLDFASRQQEDFLAEDVAGLLPFPAETVKFNQIVMYKELGEPVSYALAPLHLPEDRWVYISDQRPDEAWLFTQYTTREEDARMCFHSSFIDNFYDGAPDTPGRRSCEFRIYLAWPKKKLSSAKL